MSKAKGFAIGAISILGGAVAIGGTLSIISNRFEEITNKAILRYRDFNEPFIKNLDNILSSGDNIKQLKYLSDTLEVQLHSVELSALQKYVLIQQMGQKQKDIIYQWAQSQIDNDTLNAKSVLILRQLLEGQTKRIQELDLKAQFNSLELSNLKLSLYNFSSLSKQQQTKWFNDYKQALDFALDTQFKLVSQQLMQYKNSLDDNVLQLERLLPTKALKAKAVQNIHQIEDSIFEPSFRINDLARNKRVVEHILSDAKSTKFDVIREKFANNMDKMKSLVNANVVNVAQNIINYTNHIYPLSLDIQNQLLDLKTKLNVDANIEFNYAIIKTILESIENSQKLSKKEFIEILELNSVNNYLSLAHHYLQHTSQLLDASVSEADLDNALNNLKTAKKMIDSSASAIPVIVNEFKSFVNSFANSFTHLDKLFKSLSTDNAYVKVLSANADNYSKTDLIKGITKYRNLINQIYVSEQKLALNTNKLDLLATSETEIINKDEVAQFKKEIREIANSQLDVVKALELIETKINAIESLIDTRSEFKEIVNSVKNNVLDWNVTNDQIRAKYISNQAVQLGTDLINQVRDLVVKTELDSNKIVNTKYALREQLRSIQKIQLLHLQKQTHLDIVSLKNLDNLIATKFDTKTAQKYTKNAINTHNLVQLATQINAQSNVITSSKFNPITSEDLQTQINKYLFLVNALERANTQNKNLVKLLEAKQYAQIAFNSTQLNPAQYSKVEQAYLENLEADFAQYSNLNTKINDAITNFVSLDNSQWDKKQLEEVFEYDKFNKANKKTTNLVSQNQQIAVSGAKVSDILDELRKAKADIIAQHDDPDSFAVEFAQIDEIEAQLAQKLTSPNVDFAEIDKLTKQSDELLHKVVQMRKDGSLNVKLNKLKDKIDSVFEPKDETKMSPGEANIRARWKDLYNQAQDQNLTKEEKLILHEKINALRDVIDKVKELETVFDAYKTKENEYSKSNEGGTNVPTAIAAAQNLKDDIQTILSTISLNEKTPTAASIDQLIRQVKDSNTALELAYAKDKILVANNNFETLKTQIPQDPESGEVLKDSIDKLISYAKSKQNIDSTTDAKDSQELMSNEVKLVHSLTEAIKAKAKITQNSLLPESEAKQDTDVLAKIIAQNLPNVETDPIDTPEIIAAKVAKVNNAIAVTEQKHELRKTLVNNLHKILPAEQNDWKLYGGLKTKLDALETKYRNILNSDPSTYSPEEIERQEKELKAQIAKLEQEKAQIDKDYEDAKQKSEQTKNELGSRINILKEQNKDSFPIHFTNYEAALAKYEEEIASRPNSTTKSLKEKEQALKEAYFKDLAIHKKEEFKSFVSQEIDTLDHADKAKVKDVATAFNNYAEDLVKKPLDESKVEEFINISREMKAYNKTQADIVKFIKELEESDEPTKDKALPQLKLLLESAYHPTQPYSVTDIQKKTAEINRKWEEIKAEAAIRSENRIHSEKMQEGFKDFVAKPELSDGKNTKRKAANELLESLNLQDKTPISENSVDKLMPELANKALAKLIEDNKKATSLEQLRNVKAHIETVDKIQPYIDALGLQIASVEAQKDDLERANTELTQSYAEKYLSTLITKAREDYGLLAKVGHGEQNLKDAFAKRIKELDQAKALVKDVKKLEELLKNVEEINKNTNYSEVKGIQGNSNIKTVNEWLQKIVNEAAYDQLNQSVEAQRAKIEQASLKVEAAKKHLEKQKEVADKIAAWKAQRDADSKYSSTLKDEEQLTSNMWKILVELTATTSDVDTINSKTRALTDALTTQEAIRTKRVETRELIDSIKEESSYEQAGHYPQLKQLLDTKITQLKTQKRNADTIEQLQQVQDEVALVKQILPKQVELGAKVSEIIQFNAALIPLNTEIAQKQTELSNALAEAEKLLVKEVPTKAEITQRIADIDKTIKTLDLHKARVNVFQEWTEIKQKVDDNDTIFAEEKIALTEILQRFTTELNAIKLDENTDATQFKNILNKYIEGETEQSVPYLLKLSEELSDTLSKAKDVLETNVRVEGENVSSSAVKALYDDLTKYVDESKTGIQNRSKASIENKKEIIKNTRLKVRAIIDEKVNSIKGVRAKAHELKVVALKHPELNSAVRNDFEQNAITALTDMPTIDYTNAIVEIKRLDSAIAKAIAANTKAIKSIYEIQHKAINSQYNAANSLVESINVKDIWTTTTSNKYNEIKTLLTSLKEYSIQKIYQDDALKKFAELETTHNFVTEYLNRNLELVAEAKEKISTFKTSAKGDIELILSDSGKVKKFIDYVSSKDTITSSQPQASNSAKSKLEAVGFSDIKGIYDRVSSEYSTNKDISSLSLADQNVNEIQKHLLNSKKLIEEIDSFFSKLKEKTTEFLRVRDTTDEIMNYVFKEEHRADGRRTIDAIYNPKRDELKSEEQKITKTKADNFISDSFINSVENDIFAKLYDFKNIMSTDEVKSAFKAILNTETPEVKNTVLPSEFKKELKAITDQATGDTLEITYNDRLLQMFNKFGNTTIDNSAKFNPVYVKVYLVKHTSTNEWFTEDSKNETNQKVKIKVKYEYKPDNLNIFADDLKGFDDEKEYTITLTNAKSLGLANKSRHIFYNDNNEHGYNAKQVIGNVGDLGWDVTQKDKVIEKVVQKISKAFGIENGKSILISHGENKIYDLVKAGVNNTSGSLNEKSELNLEKSNIKFIFPEFHIYQQSSSINSFNTKQYVSLSADNKTITAKIIVPSNLIVGKQNWSENKNSIHEKNGLIDDSKAMPSALINTIKFSFDYDQDKKDISMYISHYDSYHLAKHKSLQADGIFKAEGDKVIKNDVNNNNQATYIWTADQFAKYLAIHESEWDALKVSQIKEKYAIAGINNLQKIHGNGYSGKEITGKFWVKNPRSAGEYIKTNSESQPQMQQTLNGTNMAAVFNSGIEIFKFEDIKES